MINDSNAVITKEEIAKADETLRKYKEGKASIDNAATNAQEWWRIRHWDQFSRSKYNEESEKPASAWLFNSIINRHADAMDNFPKPNILPRTAEDEEEAKTLSEIIPVILEQTDYESTYSQSVYDLLIEGGSITGTFWDQTANNGKGTGVIKTIDVHSIFWEPGIDDIQDSANVFVASLVDVDAMKIAYPDFADEIEPMNTDKIVQYLHDDNIDTTNKTEVIDWYYKKTVLVGAEDEQGELIASTPKTVLHYVKYCGDIVLYSSEDDPEYAEMGYYWHGEYPFTVKRLFPIKDTIWGFGFVDVMKSPQKYIDVVDQAILKNALMISNPRFFIKQSSEVDPKILADWSRALIPVSGADLDSVIMPLNVGQIPGAVMNYQQQKIDELKETSCNRDFSQGSVANGVTAASAIASLQEAGAKVPRDINKSLYRAHQHEIRLLLECIRQFGTEQETYRVDDGAGGYQFVTHDNTFMQNSIFDIQIVAEKQSPFSQAAQNETAKEMYGMGMFNPEAALPALVCIEMMEFEGKEKVKQEIQQNSMIMQQLQQMTQLLMQADQMLPGIAAAAGIAPPPTMQEEGGEPNGEGYHKPEHTPEEKAGVAKSEHSLVKKARQRAANVTSPH